MAPIRFLSAPNQTRSQVVEPVQVDSIEMPMKFLSAGTSGTSGTITRRILCYGDSLTAGFYDGGHWFQPYGRILADEMAAYGGRCEVVVCGLSGLSAEDMVAKSNSTLVDICGVAWKGISRVLNEDGPFDLAILMAGTNDLPYPAKRRAAATNIGKLHIACHEVGVPTLALAMPPAPCGSQLWCRDREVLLKQMKKVLANFAHNAMLDYQRMTFFDPAALLNPEDKMLWDSDGLHFSQVGSVVLGKSLAKLVLKLERPESEGSFSRQIRGKQIPASPISRQQWAMKSTVVKFELPPGVQGWNSSKSSKLSIGRCLKLQCM